MRNILLTLVLLAAVQVSASPTTTVKESDITKCKTDSDCLIVPYRHCCGSSKKAINKKYLTEYNKSPSWQKFDNPQSCAVMGQCMSDEKVKSAKCEAGQCQLRFP